MLLRIPSTVWLLLSLFAIFLCLPTLVFAQPGPPPGVDPNLMGSWVAGPGGITVYRFLTPTGNGWIM